VGRIAQQWCLDWQAAVLQTVEMALVWEMQQALVMLFWQQIRPSSNEQAEALQSSAATYPLPIISQSTEPINAGFGIDLVSYSRLGPSQCTVLQLEMLLTAATKSTWLVAKE